MQMIMHADKAGQQRLAAPVYAQDVVGCRERSGSAQSGYPTVQEQNVPGDAASIVLKTGDHHAIDQEVVARCDQIRREKVLSGLRNDLPLNACCYE